MTHLPARYSAHRCFGCRHCEELWYLLGNAAAHPYCHLWRGTLGASDDRCEHFTINQPTTPTTQTT